MTEEPSMEEVDENYLSDGKEKDRSINQSARKISQHSVDIEMLTRHSKSRSIAIPKDTEHRIKNKI